LNLNNAISKHSMLGLEIIENMHSMILYWDKDLVCRFANYACEDWFNAKPIDIIDKKTLGDLFGIKHLEKTQTFIREVLGGTEQVFKIDIQTRSGEVRNAIATYLPDSENGEIKGFYAQIVDVSSLHNQLFVNGNNGVENTRQYLNGNFKPLLEVVTFLKANLTTGFPGITQLAKKIFISESKLKRDFKANYGITVFDYYRHLQMELAEKYMYENKASKKQMAILLNFSNPSNFSVCFRKYLIYKKNRTRFADSEKVYDERYHTFISQLPVAAAMFDNEMLFMAASQKWIDDNKLKNTDLKGKSFFEIFQGTEAKYKELLGQCLKGTSKNITGLDFGIEPDSSKRTRWNISTWIKENNEIGGLIICSEDFTAQ
jgi:AraC-like DNA-binding protein